MSNSKNDDAYTTVVNLARDYSEARTALDEIRESRGVNPGEGQLTALLSKVDTFDSAVELAFEFRKLGYFTGRGFYEAVFAKPIVEYSAGDLLAVYNSLPFKFDSSLGSPIRQYRQTGQPNQVFLVCLAEPHIDSAQRYFREEYELCLRIFEAELSAGNDEDNLHYAFGIAAALNEDWSTARKHLKVALERAYHEKRIAYINELLATRRAE